MKKRNSIEILVKLATAASPLRLRIIPKPSRYQETRYWVVLPGAGASGDRWLLEPSIERAVGRVNRWLLPKTRCNSWRPSIIGEFPSPEERAQPQIQRRDDGSWLIDAASDIQRVEKALPGVVFSQDEQERFQTLAGFVTRHLGHVPREGEGFQWRGYLFEVLDMDRHRVDKVLVTPDANSSAQISKPHTPAASTL